MILLLSVVLIYKHLTVMPFHNPIENFVRGGIYFAVRRRRPAPPAQNPLPRAAAAAAAGTVD